MKKELDQIIDVYFEVSDGSASANLEFDMQEDMDELLAAVRRWKNVNLAIQLTGDIISLHIHNFEGDEFFIEQPASIKEDSGLLDFLSSETVKDAIYINCYSEEGEEKPTSIYPVRMNWGYPEL